MEKRNDIGQAFDMLIIDVKSIARRATKGKRRRLSRVRVCLRTEGDRKFLTAVEGMVRLGFSRCIASL